MPKYRKKPVVIEAIQLLAGTRHEDILAFVGDAVRQDGNEVYIRTLEGDMHASVGDYIIRGVQGEFYPCKPAIFEATYEAVGD